MKTIGIIGTHGKTSILHIIEMLFTECNKNIGVIGDLGFRINKKNLTDEYSKLTDVVKEMRKNQVEYLFIELHEKDCQFEDHHFDCIIFSDFDKREYTKDKCLFFRQSISGTMHIIVNSDSETSLSVMNGVSNSFIITYGLNHKSTVTASTIEMAQEKIHYNYALQRGFVSHGGKAIIVQEMPVELSLIGYQNIYNTLACITTALLYDLDIEKAIATLRDMRPIPNRIELLKTHDVKVLVDMAKDNHSFKMLFETLQGLFYKKIYIGISIENVKSVLNGSNLEDFISDFSFIRGASISIIGDLKDNVLSKDRRKLLIDAIVKNNIIFDYFIDDDSFFYEYKPKMTEDDLLVWVGSRFTVEKYLR